MGLLVALIAVGVEGSRKYVVFDDSYNMVEKLESARGNSVEFDNIGKVFTPFEAKIRREQKEHTWRVIVEGIRKIDDDGKKNSYM